MQKEQQQVRVLLDGKTFAVDDKSEDNIYLSLSEWSEQRYNNVSTSDLSGEKTLTVNSYFPTEKGNLNLRSNRGGAAGKGRRSSSSIITYQVVITVSGNEVTAVPRLIDFCRPRSKSSEVGGTFSDFNCQKVDNSFNGYSFRILNYFNEFYDRVEKVAKGA